ncbi:Mitochondrial translocator assembly and maintenance protein 41 [Cystobasidiomycetes sp. EMM_F5]
MSATSRAYAVVAPAVSRCRCRRRRFQPPLFRSYATESEQFILDSFAGPPPPPPSSPSSVTPKRPLPLSADPWSSGVKSNKPSSWPRYSTSSTSKGEADIERSHDGEEQSTHTLSGQRSTADSKLPAKFGLNQHTEIQSSELHNELSGIVNDFRAPIRHAFAYGSGVFRQKGYSSEAKPMLDFIVAVSHPSHWHSINVNQNPAHYSLLARTLGSGIIGFTQERVGAGAWFNVDCQVRGRTIKYGVVSVDTLVRDLMDWETLYFAGRMHKPLHILRSDPRVRLANQVNLSSAVRAALLLLPETFAEEDLYAEIAGLSYRGDFRMAVGENPRKVRNIVEAQGEQFQEVYKPILNSFHKHISFMGPEGSGSIRQDIDPKAKANLAKRLPARLRDAVKTHYDRSVNTSTAFGRNGLSEPEMSRMEEQAIWTKLVSQGDFKKNLDASIQDIVGQAAYMQSAKGIISVGPIRGLRYVWPKIQKKWFPSK